MSKYPKVKFGDFVEHVIRAIELEADKDYPSVGVKWYGEGVHVHEVKGGGSFNAARFEIKENDIIYNDMWARNGSVAIVPPHLDGAVASSHFPTFLPDTSRVLPKYLQYYFKTPTFWDACENASRGSTGRNQIKRSTFYAIEIPLPPVDEQYRIVERVEALASHIAKAQLLRDEADEESNVFIASLSNQLLNGINAEEVTLGSVVLHARNGFGRRPKTEEKGPIVLRLADVSTGMINLTNPRRVEMTEDEFREFEVRKGDIIFVRVNGSLPIVGRCIPCDIDFQEKVTYNDHLIRARVDITKLYSRYATVLLNSPDMRKLIQSKAITTAGQYSISQSSILSLPIKLPPLDEQRRIVAYLDSVQARLASLRELQSATGEELSALLPSVLDRAFKGEL